MLRLADLPVVARWTVRRMCVTTGLMGGMQLTMMMIQDSTEPQSSKEVILSVVR